MSEQKPPETLPGLLDADVIRIHDANLAAAIRDVAAVGLTAIYYFFPSEDPNFKFHVGNVFMTYRALLRDLMEKGDGSDS